ncbi:hypothetical protein [Lysinibacillus sp. NPDC056232]|uniref:hypothetical protein n=1 Tax=Lysinibacillus sp. NPDC056232 TaxID=3345756 RepID=UPI0035D8CFD7
MSTFYLLTTESGHIVYLCESKATATNVLCSESAAAATLFFCAKAQRQQHCFSVRKRSGSNIVFLCESAAAATIIPRHI